jgi:intracellular sulfur oxidation DsrE/DsrF family protein
MSKRRWLAGLFVVLSLIGASALFARMSVAQETAKPLHIDVPVKLAKWNVVVDVGHWVPVGKPPFLTGDIQLLASNYTGGPQGNIVTVFHGDAASLVLNDAAYNANHNVQTGNPYAKIIEGWMKQGVQVELCGATAAANHWGNADLLPGVKVNTNAMVRVTQLEQQGYTQIYE